MKILNRVLLCSFFVFGFVSISLASGSATSTNDAGHCVSDAVIAREVLLHDGWTTFGEAVESAYATRKTALADAYGKATTSEIKSSVNEAWKNFKKAVKKAKSEWKQDRKDAWAEFRSDRKECRASDIVDDSTNQSADVQ